MDATAELFRRQGYTGTGLKQIVAEASAPFGSIYHFFPGGKEQLGTEVIRRSGRLYLELFITIAAASPDAVSGVAAFFTGAAEHLRETDYADACPIATVALEASSSSEPLREACAEVFEEWIAGLTATFAAAGVADARALAIEFLCALEGAFVFCRALRTTEALDVAGARVAESVRRALG